MFLIHFSKTPRITWCFFSLFLLLLILLPQTSLAANNTDTIIHNAYTYLINHQNSDGGIHEDGVSTSDTSYSAWSALAFAIGGYDPTLLTTDEASLLSAATANACTTEDTKELSRIILLASALHKDVTTLFNCDTSPIVKLMANLNTTTGQIGTNTPDITETLFGAMALKSTGTIIPSTTIYDYIVSQQLEDGGWISYKFPGGTSDSNATAQAIMTLQALHDDRCNNSIVAAKSFLKTLQLDSGGIRYDTGEFSTTSDAFSNAYALQAIYALHENPFSDDWKKNNRTIISDLVSLQSEDGSFNFTAGNSFNPVFTTYTVLPALLHQSFPVTDISAPNNIFDSTTIKEYTFGENPLEFTSCGEPEEPETPTTPETPSQQPETNIPQPPSQPTGTTQSSNTTSQTISSEVKKETIVVKPTVIKIASLKEEGSTINQQPESMRTNSTVVPTATPLTNPQGEVMGISSERTIIWSLIKEWLWPLVIGLGVGFIFIWLIYQLRNNQ